MTIYRIKSPYGYVRIPEKISGFNFPLSTTRPFNEATIFNGEREALATIRVFHLNEKVHVIEKFEE